MSLLSRDYVVNTTRNKTENFVVSKVLRKSVSEVKRFFANNKLFFASSSSDQVGSGQSTTFQLIFITSSPLFIDTFNKLCPGLFLSAAAKNFFLPKNIKLYCATASSGRYESGELVLLFPLCSCKLSHRLKK